MVVSQSHGGLTDPEGLPLFHLNRQKAQRLQECVDAVVVDAALARGNGEGVGDLTWP